MTDQILEQLQSSKMPDDHLLKVVDLGPAPPASKKSDGNTAFLRAARSGNLEKVLEFINANVDINTSNANGLNALHLASKDGHAEVVVELLKRGANVDAATKKGNTALHIASLAGQEEVVKLLVEHGASVNVQSQSGFTPLYMAAQENHERVVRFLLNHGANQNLATEDGFTPLAVAMQQGNDKVVTELLENDTRGKIRLPALHIAAKKDDCKAAALLLQSEHNPDITSKSGFTPLHIASHYGNDAIASLLLAKGADVNYAAKHNITPLHVAAKWGRNNMVILLLDKGACITAKTRDGLTPLHCAARSGHEQVVDTLLQRHAPITAKTKNGLAPLHMASQGDHVEAARVLLSHRAPVDDVTVDYLTALHVASHCGHVSVAKLLLDRKADPNARALNGFTPLHIACKKNRVKIVELLLKHGASIEATTESGLSPLHVASFMGCMNIVIYLLQCEANPDVSTIRGETPLHLASRANQTDIIRILLRNGAQVDAKAREQQTPLHIASRLGNTDIVMLLLQHGASVDAVTKDLYTPLHIAAKEDQEEVAQTLLENNATLTATTKKGFTPLHLAAKYGRTKIATLLLQRGAPVDAQGKNGVTPLHVASHYDHQGIALQLLDKGASPHATAKNGHTPLHIAAKKNQMDIAAMLLEYGANADIESKAGFTPLHLAAQGGHADMTNLLLEHKADVNHSSKNGLTPLHLCAQEDCVEVAKILVKNGADVNAVTKAAYTPLHIASHFGQLNMVRFLLSQKAKVDTITSTGYTPLHQAAQQGNSAIVAVLLDNGASPETKNNQGQTALYIAQKLGYISVVEVLKNVTEGGKVSASTVSGSEEKYKVVAPETMQENFMSDSEDEGGDDAINETSYRYLTIDEMKSLGDDSLPLDITKEDRYDTTAGVDESISPQHTYNQLSAAPVPDNVDVTRAPVIQTGFLVSFLVDAKGGAMRGCRHSGVRVIVPPQSVTMPTRVTCRYVRRDKPNHPPPPPLMEGEALSSRILELGPVGVKFLGPVVIEVPNFAALRGNEREIVILRSDNGETWREHTVDSSQEVVQEILSRSFDKDGNQIQLDEPGRITAIVTSDFPHYFAIVSRIRQEVHAIGPEGGMVSSSVVPQVQAVFPQGALTKKIKVGLQAQPIPSELTAAILGNCVAVSPIVTIEPRRRKFHKPITLTLPVPQAANKGMINQYSGDAPTLRLLCSITGGTSRAQWEDVTGSTPLTFVKECVSFTTTVSARFWLMDIRDIAMATKKATELYREAIHIPFMAKFVVFAKRIDNNEARLRVFCMTDDKEDKTLECQEHFTEVAKSRDVEVLEGKKQLIELSGNLISVTKSGEQLKLGFSAFHENRLPFTVRIKDSLADPIGRMLFFKEQKPVKTSTPHPPICVLNIVLPDGIVPDPECLGSPMLKYNFFNDTQDYHRSEVRFSDISNLIGEDWIPLSEKLCISSGDVNVIKSEYPESVAKQALTMLRIWHQQAGSKASPNILENALLSIGRQDIVQECILNTTEQQKKHKHAEKEAYSKEIISEVIEDYHVGKKNTYTTDDDEKKYTAEEKAIDEHESKKSVSERKMEIERRLLGEPTSKSSTEHYENEEKRQLPDRETEVVKRQKPEQLDIVKSVVYDDKEEIEPTSLTFQQKRLSFERGLSVDKILSEQIVDSVSIKEEKLLEKPKTEKKEDRIMHINKEKIKKDDKSLFTDPENSKFEKLILEKTPTGESETFINEEKTLSFAEKRLSFEQADGTKIPPTQSEIKVTEKTEVPKRSVEDTRRDSELFESVSVGLRKLDTHPSPAVDQCYLSPNPVKTPPPSPAEFKVHDLQKKDSVESSKSGKSISDEDPDLKSENTSELTTASLDDTTCTLTQRRLSRAKEQNVFPCVSAFYLSRYYYKRSYSMQDELTIDDISSLATISKSHFDSISHSAHVTAVRPSDRINLASFKTHFAASCLPPCIWNQSLPNLYMSSSTSDRQVADFGLTVTLPHSSSIEYFTPEQNFTPQYGAYCTWSSYSEENSEETFDRPASQFVKINPDEVLQLQCDTEITPPAIAASCAELIKSESVCEIMHEDGIAYYQEKDNLDVTIEPIQLTTLDGEITAPVAQVSDFYPQQEENFTELIDRLIEQENAKLLASGQLSYESDADSSTEEEVDLKEHRYVSELSESTNMVNGKPENCKAEDEYANNEKLHQRKVAFRLNSAEDDLVYPGQTDSEECSSSSENYSEELIDNIVKEKLSMDDVQEEDSLVNNDEVQSPELHSNFQPFTEIERKFERMASETLEEESDKMAEGEFHRIVSQLSLEEVDDCLNAWNEAEVVVGNEKAVQLEGNVQQHSYTTSDTSLVQSQANFDNIAKDKSEKCDNMNYVSKKKFWQSFESTGSECKPTPVPKPRASICTTGIRDDTPPVASKRSFENICPLVSKDVIKSESVDNIVAAYSRSLSKPTIKQMHSLTAYSTDSEAEYIASCGIEKLAYENIAFSEEEEDRSLDISSVDGGVKAKKMFFEQMQKESITNLEDSVVSPPILSSTKIETKINKFEEHFDKSEMEATEKKEIHIENVVDQRTAIPIDVTTTMNICSIEKGVDSTRLESYIIPVDLRHKEYSQPSFESISVGSHKRTSSDRVIEGLLNQDSAEVHKTRDSLLEDSEMIQTSINNVRVAGNESAMTTFLMGVTNTEIANEKVDIKVEDNVRSTEDVHKESRNENGHENELFTNASVLSEENFESYYMENVSEENTKSKMFSELITSVAKEPLSDFTDEVHIRFSYEEGRFSNKVPDIKTAEHSENETKNKIKEVSMQPRNNSSNEAELTKLSLETKSIHEEKFTNTKVKIMKIQDSKIETLPVEKESEQEQNIIMKIPVPKSPFGSFGNEGTITENILVTETSHVRLEQNPFVTQIESVNNEIEKSHGKPVAESKIPISKCSATDKIASLKRETSTKELKSNQTGSPIIKNPDHEKNIQEATSTKMVETVTIESSKNVEEKCSMWSPSKNNNELASVDGIILQSESHSHFNKCEDKSPSVLTTGTKMEYYSDVEDLKTTDFEILTSDETNIPDSFCIKKPEVTCILQSEITSTLSEKTSSDDSHAHTKGYDVSKLKLCENESCKEFRTEDEMESVITKVKKSKIPVLSSHIETISQPFTICFHEKEGASLNKTLDKCKTQASFEKSVKDSSSVVTETIDDRLKSSAVAESEAVDSKPVITETVFNKFVFLEDTETLTNTMVEHMISCKSEPPVTKTVVTETVDSETAADIKIIDTKSNDSVFSIVSGQSATNTSPIISEKMSMKLESVIASEKSLVTDTVSTESSKSKSSIIFEKPVSITCAMLTETVSSRDNTQATSQSELLFMSNMKITDIDCSESELSTVSEKLFPTNTIVMETISTQSKPQNVSNFDDSMKKKIKFDKYESSTIPEEPSSVINTFVESNLIPHVSQTVSEKFAVVNNVEDMKSNACIKENISNISTAEITKAIVGKSESLDGKPAVIDTTVTKSNFDADKLQNIFEKPIEITSKQVKQTTSNVHEYQIFPENIIVASTVEAEITSHKSEPTVEKSADIFTAETVFHHEPELSATREESAREMVLTENISSKSECSAIPCESLLPRKLTSSIPSVCETQHDNSVVIVERTSAEEKYKKANCKFHFESPSSDASSRATSTRIFLDNEIIDEIYKEQTEFILLDESSHETGVSDEQIVTYDSDNKRILISEDEAKIVAENLVMEIETEINKRPDIIENLLLLRHADLLRAASGDPSDDISNDITDEDLRSTGTEVDLPVAENHEFYQKNEICDRLGKNVLFAETAINIGEASPTEYEISYEQAEEFNILESVDFTDQLVPLEVDRDMKSVNKPSKPQLSGIHTQSETERKNSDEFGARNDILSPESGTSDSARRCEDIISCSRGRKSTADMEPCSSSSESHYLSFTSDNRTTGSRPCSSDIEGLLSSVLPGTTGSSEYDTAVSQDTTSFYSHDFYTAVSSASLHESLKSMESESSGHQGSAEVSSEISETLVPSSAELEHDIDIPAHGIVFENNRRLLCHKLPLEPYDQDIPVNVIRAASSSIITSQTKTTTCAPISIKDFSDDKMISSNEDTSSISTTDGATLPTMFEVASNESDRLDNSLISEQSLTMSSASYQFDAKENVDVDHKVVDTNTFITSVPNVHKKLPSITMITSTIHDEGRQHVCTQMTSKVENLLSSTNESPAAISPESESFELVEKPDLLDDFVVIEEVAKEACEEDEEGKGIRIIMKRKSKLYDEEQSPPPKTNSTLTQVKYYSTGGTPEDGYNFEGVTFEQEKQSPDKELYENSPPNDNLYEHEVEEGKKWIERQFQTDSEVASEYEYTFERIPLEDIKEEDTDDMQSSKVGSVSSQISQSVGSFGSMKQSLSSTPDYDILAGKRYFSKPTEPDTISQASLQEFERLEQLIALESMKGKLSGSQDSIASSSNGSDKKRSGDDISVSSLKVFEGLEYACVEAEKIEERAKAEERSLSQIEEGHESQASESESCETLEKSQYESEEDENDYDRKMFEIDEIIRQAQSNVEQFVNVDHLEKTESLGRGDSFEETSRIPDFELDRPLTDINCGKKYIENVDASRSLTTSTDSLELKHAVHFEDTLFTSTDSLEAKVRHDVASDSLDSDRQEDECRANTISDRSCISEKGGDFLADDVEQPCRFSPNQISSPDSGEATSSATTHATYQNEADSIMSSSFTSGGSNTMISSTENLENIISGYSNWLDGSQSYVTEVVETVSEDKNYITTHHTVEIAGDGVKTVGYQGPDARTLMERDIADFKPGEYCSETQDIDADGTVHIRRIVEMRTVVSSEQVESSQKFTFGGRSSSSDDGIRDVQVVSHTQSSKTQPGGDRTGSTVADVLTEKKSEIADETATDQKKPH